MSVFIHHTCSGTQVHLTGFCTKNSRTGAASLCLTAPPHLWIILLETCYNNLKCVTTELPRVQKNFARILSQRENKAESHFIVSLPSDLPQILSSAHHTSCPKAELHTMLSHRHWSFHNHCVSVALL